MVRSPVRVSRVQGFMVRCCQPVVIFNYHPYINTDDEYFGRRNRIWVDKDANLQRDL